MANLLPKAPAIEASGWVAATASPALRRIFVVFCDSGLDSIESPGILTIIDGPEHDELSQVYSHLSSYHVGSHVPTCP